MQSSKHQLKTAMFEDGTYVVLRADRANPRLLEVIGTFYESAHAQDYVRLRGAPSEEPQGEKPYIVKGAAKAIPRQGSASKTWQASKAKQLSAGRPKRTAGVPVKRAPEANSENAAAELSGRQAAVLKALRSLMDKNNHVEVRVAELARASSVPLGSVHSILVSLEKKHMIRTKRQGSPKFSAIYAVLETSRKSTRPLNGLVHSKVQ